MGKSCNNKRVILGMSGGVDSAVSAALLKKDGYEVIGITFLFSDEGEVSEISLNDAKAIAKQLQIEHHVIDLRNEFRSKIIQRFIHEYEEGKTPFPCAFCNPEIKFYHLIRLSKIYQCDYISTGHYAQITSNGGIKYIAKGTDKEKDQSFFLWGLSSEIVNKLVLPLGGFNKAEIRKFAKNKRIPGITAKKDSMGICFVNAYNYRNFLISNGLKMKTGNFVDEEGNILGQHQGIANYTIGQRRGLGINLNKPLFVSEISAEKNEVVLSEYDQLYRCNIFLRGTHFINSQSITENSIYIVKIRYRLQENYCRITITNNDHAQIHLLEPVAMVAPGQTAVIYENDRVIGGGFIQSSEKC